MVINEMVYILNETKSHVRSLSDRNMHKELCTYQDGCCECAMTCACPYLRPTSPLRSATQLLAHAGLAQSPTPKRISQHDANMIYSP